MEVISNFGATVVSYVAEKTNFDIGAEGRVVRGVVATAQGVQLLYATAADFGGAVVDSVSGAISAVSPTLPLVLVGLYMGFSHAYKESPERNSYDYRTDVHREERHRQDKIRHERRLRLMKLRNFSQKAILEELRRYDEEKYGGPFDEM